MAADSGMSQEIRSSARASRDDLVQSSMSTHSRIMTLALRCRGFCLSFTPLAGDVVLVLAGGDHNSDPASVG